MNFFTRAKEALGFGAYLLPIALISLIFLFSLGVYSSLRIYSKAKRIQEATELLNAATKIHKTERTPESASQVVRSFEYLNGLSQEILTMLQDQYRLVEKSSIGQGKKLELDQWKMVLEFNIKNLEKFKEGEKALLATKNTLQ